MVKMHLKSILKYIMPASKFKPNHIGLVWFCLLDNLVYVGVQGVPEQKLRGHLGSLGVTGNLALQPMYTLSGSLSLMTMVLEGFWTIDRVLKHLYKLF